LYDYIFIYLIIAGFADFFNTKIRFFMYKLVRKNVPFL